MGGLMRGPDGGGGPDLILGWGILAAAKMLPARACLRGRACLPERHHASKHSLARSARCA